MSEDDSNLRNIYIYVLINSIFPKSRGEGLHTQSHDSDIEIGANLEVSLVRLKPLHQLNYSNVVRF